MKFSNPFNKKNQPSRTDRMITVGKNAAILVGASWLIQKGCEGLDAAVKGSAQGVSNYYKTAKENLAARREAASQAAQAQASAAEETASATTEQAPEEAAAASAA